MGEGGNWSMGPGCHGRSSNGFFTPSMSSGSSSSSTLQAYHRDNVALKKV